MLFNSLEFLIFFPIVSVAFFLLPHGMRWAMLLAASCYFYMAFVPEYILILAVTIVIDYFAAIFIERSIGTKRKLWLFASLVGNIGVLAFFKYFNFLADAATQIQDLFGAGPTIPYLEIILPIGLSFHTFQAMSYTIEVYRGNQKAERHLGILSLYVLFYPQLVAGPIERPQNILHQIRERHQFSYVDAREGMARMLMGMAKKVVVADNASTIVDAIYDNPVTHSPSTLILATFFFAIQIYADFSGYSDIAIGAAQTMGFRLMTNFRRPYLSKSISEFWRRCHISLSTWFRDYLYIPLGGNRASFARWQLNLLLTFTISGLWHGANWTFVVWGALNGIYLICANMSDTVRTRISAAFGINCSSIVLAATRTIITFFLICITWVFFRARSIGDAWDIFTTVFMRLPEAVSPTLFAQAFRYTNVSVGQLAITLAACVGLLVFDWFAEQMDRHGTSIWQMSRRARWALYYVAVICIALFGQFGKQQFIYFQF